MHRLRDLIKGMRRELGERPKRVRWGVRTQQLQEAMDKCLPQGSPKQAQGWRAALALAFCMLLRRGEVAVPGGENFNPLQHPDKGRHHSGEIARWVDRAQVAHAGAKEESDDREDVHSFLRAGGKLIDAVKEVLLYLEMDASRRSGAGERNAALQAFERRIFPSGRGGADGEVSGGVYRIRSSEVRCSQPEDRRGNGSFGSWDTAHTDQGAGQVEFGYLRDLLPAFAGSGGGNGSIDRLYTV